MENRTKAEINKYAKLSTQLIQHHFPRKRITVKPLGGGLTNYVYSVKAGKDELVVRISDKPETIQSFLKEQWAVAKAKEKGVPVPEILEVGNDIIPMPYMISKKIDGEEATHHKSGSDIIKEMGRLASLIHSVSTKGFGHLFDWSQNTLSKNKTWKNFLDDELNITDRLHMLKKNKMISEKTMSLLKKELIKISKWNQQPCLQHGDLRLKNIMIDKKGNIIAVIDWENCISGVGAYWDTSIALHDLSVDAQWRYLEGYGLPDKKIMEMSTAIKVFNLLNYAPEIENIVQQKDKAKLEHYRIRLNGALDLFSL
jgi:hygromycin-B 4-O-kinase